MSKAFPVIVTSPEHSLFAGSAVSVSIATEDGEITILAGHTPLLATLQPGEVVIRHEKGVDELVIGGGVLEMTKDGILRILADLAIRSDAIDAAAAEEARQKAEKNMGEARDEREVVAAQAALLHAIMQLKIAARKNKR